ncbi:hypothetical protein [Nonomuraea aurantiaca]|uniref:hypothetical protein n=1 Tax=Nonomuraea aurantiaca TaxID=2878562 RepID=UPI001CD9425E|nr:hypothetical protein [Nonomuraea aurantiaca]MCA2229668.1 hypothetical protein [Nonomuraea aurantiaca]
MSDELRSARRNSSHSDLLCKGQSTRLSTDPVGYDIFLVHWEFGGQNLGQQPARFSRYGSSEQVVQPRPRERPVGLRHTSTPSTSCGAGRDHQQRVQGTRGGAHLKLIEAGSFEIGVVLLRYEIKK